MTRLQYLELVLLLLGVVLFCVVALVVWVLLLLVVMVYPPVVASLTADRLTHYTIGRIMGAKKRGQK